MSLKSEGSPHPFPFYMCLFYLLTFLDALKLVSQKDGCHSGIGRKRCFCKQPFSHLGVQFPRRGLRESDELCVFFSVPRTDSACASLCLRSGITSSCSPSFPTPKCSCGAFIRFRPARTHHLKLGPAAILGLHPEGAGFFSQDSRDCESLMKRKTLVPRERGANTLYFLPLKQGQWFPLLCFFLCYLTNRFPTGPSKCGQC